MPQACRRENSQLSDEEFLFFAERCYKLGDSDPMPFIELRRDKQRYPSSAVQRKNEWLVVSKPLDGFICK